MYIVKYFYGSAEIESIPLFVTKDAQIASDYVIKFNEIHRKWKEYYRQFEQNGIITEKYDHLFERWYSLRNIGDAYFCEIEER